MIHTQVIDPRTIPDSAIALLRSLAVKNISDEAPVFGEWLRKWCETESYWRAVFSTQRPKRHLIAMPPACDWSDKDLGQALKAATKLSYLDGLPVELSDLIDRISLALAEVAGDRLAAK